MKRNATIISLIALFATTSGISLAAEGQETEWSNQQYCEQQAELAGYIDNKEIQDFVLVCLEDLSQQQDVQTDINVEKSLNEN